MNKVSVDNRVENTEWQGAHPAPRPRFPAALSNKGPRLLRERTGSGAAPGRRQGEPGAACGGRNLKCSKLHKNKHRSEPSLLGAGHLDSHKLAMNLQRQASSFKNLLISLSRAAFLNIRAVDIFGDA